MARSNVSVANMALRKLGAARIVSLTDNNVNARTINDIFDEAVKQELRDHAWNFAIQRVILAPSSTTPVVNNDMAYTYAFPLPPDALRVLKPSRYQLDWTIESVDSVSCILTNDGNSISLRYVAYVADPNRWDALFAEVIACRLAVECCEQINQSNTKQEKCERQLNLAWARARRTNAFERIRDVEPEDSWVEVRRAGVQGDRNWLVFNGSGN